MAILRSSLATSTTRIPSGVFVEIVRLLIVALFTACGYELGGGSVAAPQGGGPLVGAALGACLGYVHGGILGRVLRRMMGVFEQAVERTPAVTLASGALGALLLGGSGALLGAVTVAMVPGRWGWPLAGLGVWLGLYAGFQVGARKGEELLALLQRAPVPASPPPSPAEAGAPGVTSAERPLVIVDSSAAIDGRLLAVARTGFLPGALAIPRFVLDELQGLADASDAGRRRRGRRALEVLEALGRARDIGVTVLDEEVPDHDDVDAKLVALAARRGAHLLTVDRNLVSVAELHGVPCLNLHRLGVSLQPVLVPGETVRLTVSRPGRDQGQGVGFLEDGTMVVVSDGADLVGAEADVRIMSSVQTSKGRMFFASRAA